MELIDTPNPNAKKIEIDLSSEDIEKELRKIEGVKSIFLVLILSQLQKKKIPSGS